MDLSLILDDRGSLGAKQVRPPKVGLLTRTIVPSPVVKWMLPARVRHEDKNDVIVVYENHIELKQLVRDRLRTIALKTDFDATIRAARILGEPRKLVTSPNDSESNYDDVAAANGGYGSDVSAMDLDTDAMYALPPQLLALTLRTAHAARLMFLFVQEDRAGLLRFRSSIWPLPGHDSVAGRPDAHLAVDPRSLALAVAAQNDVLVFCALKSHERLAFEVEHSRRSAAAGEEDFRPIKEQRVIDLSATILKMEFLHPPKDAASAGVVLLLIVISAGGETRLKCFEWDAGQPLRDMKDLWKDGYPIPQTFRNLAPSQLITVTNHCGFFLTFPDCMLAYSDIQSQSPRPLELQYATEDVRSNKLGPLYEFGESPRQRYWTSWARPARTAMFRETNDCLYLGREDGVVSFLTINSKFGRVERHEIGRVDVSIDSGFASLDLGGKFPHAGYDVLAIAGNSSDGGLFDYKPRGVANALPQKLHNWSPVLDWAAVPHSSPAIPATFESMNLNIGRIFTCAGYGMRHGKLCELRSGVEAICFSSTPLESLAVGRPTRLWLLDTGISDDFSMPSTLLFASPGGGSDRIAVDAQGLLESVEIDPVLNSLIDCDAETIDAAVTANEIAVQITNKAVRVVSVRPAATAPAIITRKFPYSIKHGYIDGLESLALIALCGSDGDELHCLRLSQNDDVPSIEVLSSLADQTLSAGVSCVSLYTFMRSDFTMVGTVNQMLLMHRTDGESLVQIASYAFEGKSAICESITCLQGRVRDGVRGLFVLCGLRNGTLHVLRYDQSNGNTFTPYRVFNVGHTAVWTYAERRFRSGRAVHSTSAIVACQDMLLRIYVQQSTPPRITAQRVWVTRAQPQLTHSTSIFAFGQCQSWVRRHPLSKAIGYIDERAIHLMMLDTSRVSTTVPSDLRINGTPRRVIYSQAMNRLVVAYEETVMAPSMHRQSDIPKETSGKKLTFSKFRTIDPEADPEVTTPADGQLVGVSGDRITGMIEWTPTVEAQRWRLLVISTIRKREQEGGIYIYRMAQDKGRYLWTLQKELPRGDPVYSLAAVGKSSLVYGCGLRLEVLEVKKGAKGLEWTRTPRLQIDLDSPARSLSTRDREILVTTAMDSHLVCVIDDDVLRTDGTEFQARQGLSSVHTDTPSSLILGSDTDGGVCGLQRAEDEPGWAKLEPVVEVSMPSPIYRLHRVPCTNSEQEVDGGENSIVLGVALNGSFHAFEVLDTARWRLLRFVQNTICRYSVVCPATYMDSVHRHVEPGNGPWHMHINGDILARLFDQLPSGAVFLQAVMEEVPRLGAEADFATAEQRVSRFRELLRDAIPGSTMENDEIYERFMDFLERTLQPIS